MRYLPLVLILAAAPAQAQGPVRLGVLMLSNANDPVGTRLAYQVREEIRQSSAFMLVAESPILRLDLITLDPEEGRTNRGAWAAYSVTILIEDGVWDLYLYSTLGVCGTDMVASCAERIVAKIDEKVDTYRSALEERALKAQQGQGVSP